MSVETTMQAADAPRHVLVVDDSRAQRHMVSMQLHRWGYEVSECDSGLAALELCRTQSFDIILSDWMMPGMTGWEVCRAIREDDGLAAVGVIMLTGIGERLNEMTSPLYGADEYLDKPFDFGDLDALVARVLYSRSR